MLDLGQMPRDLDPLVRELERRRRELGHVLRDLGQMPRDLDPLVRELRRRRRELGHVLRDLGQMPRDLDRLVRDLRRGLRDREWLSTECAAFLRLDSFSTSLKIGITYRLAISLVQIVPIHAEY